MIDAGDKLLPHIYVNSFIPGILRVIDATFFPTVKALGAEIPTEDGNEITVTGAYVA